MDKIRSLDGTIAKLTQKVVEDLPNKQYTPIVNTRSTMGGNLTITVNGGANPIAFPSQVCTRATIINNTGNQIEVQQDAAGFYLPIISGTPQIFEGITNIHELAVRRSDLNAASVTVSARWEI